MSFAESLSPSAQDLLGLVESTAADGTIVWTSPTGHIHTTKPGSALLFPTLCLPTGELQRPEQTPTIASDQRGLVMPKRRRTRAENLAKRIEAERKLNDEHVTERTDLRPSDPEVSGSNRRPYRCTRANGIAIGRARPAVQFPYAALALRARSGP
jgi:hypothetical protein